MIRLNVNFFAECKADKSESHRTAPATINQCRYSIAQPSLVALHFFAFHGSTPKSAAFIKAQLQAGAQVGCAAGAFYPLAPSNLSSQPEWVFDRAWRLAAWAKRDS
jgi:hypothetical protein